MTTSRERPHVAPPSSASRLDSPDAPVQLRASPIMRAPRAIGKSFISFRARQIARSYQPDPSHRPQKRLPVLDPGCGNLPVPPHRSQVTALAVRVGSNSTSQGYRSAPATRATFQLGSSRSVGCHSDGSSQCSSRNFPSARRRIAPPGSAQRGRASRRLPVTSGSCSPSRAATSEAMRLAIDGGISTQPLAKGCAPSDA